MLVGGGPSLLHCHHRPPRRPAAPPPAVAAASAPWLPAKRPVVVSVKKADANEGDVLALLRYAHDNPPVTREQLGVLMAHATAVALAFALDDAPSPDDTAPPDSPPLPPASLSALLPRAKRRRLVGFGRAWGDTALVGLLADVVVSPDERRRGVGNRLVRALLGELRRKGVGDICATVPAGGGGEAFFCALGFRQDRAASRLLLTREPLRPVVLDHERIRAAIGAARERAKPEQQAKLHAKT